MNQIEIAVVKRGGLGFRRVDYPLTRHYILIAGRTETRIICPHGNERMMPLRALAVLSAALVMFKLS